MIEAKKYFTGKPCKRGHISERYVITKHCCACNSFRMKSWREKNPQLAADTEKRNRLKRDKEKHNLYLRGWKKKNKDKVAADKKAWDDNNKEHQLKYAKEYRIANPHVKRRGESKRRARKRGGGGSHTTKEVIDMLTAQQNKCACCNTRLVKYHVDHILPLVLGGSDNIDNIQILCPPCNQRKSAKHPDIWARENGKNSNTSSF